RRRPRRRLLNQGNWIVVFTESKINFISRLR
ncbi:unnamed protein product, partial [Linum tenue]